MSDPKEVVVIDLMRHWEECPTWFISLCEHKYVLGHIWRSLQNLYEEPWVNNESKNGERGPLQFDSTVVEFACFHVCVDFIWVLWLPPTVL